MTPPADLIPVIGHPDYGINAAGEVWRLRRKRPNASYPVPRPLAPMMMGTKPWLSPHFRFDLGGGRQATKSLAQLMREHFTPARTVVRAPTLENV